MIKGKEPQIIRMRCATVIHTQDSFFIYDKSAGEHLTDILCIASKNIPESFIKDMEASKIIKVVQSCPQDNRDYFSFSIIVSPQFGYKHQTMEDVIFQLMIKYEL